MSISRDALIARGKAIAQNGDGATGIQLLLKEPDDYQAAVVQALGQFGTDRPNKRIRDITLGTTGFRYALTGSGAILPTVVTDPDAWVRGGSWVQAVFLPWLSTAQGQDSLDENTWRVVEVPPSSGALPDEALELLADTGTSGKVLRLVYAVPHLLDDTDPTKSTVRAADVTALATLTAAWILMLAANKALQNTGTTNLPNDVVDRRSQSDQMKSRAKELRDLYGSLIGQGPDAGPASGSLDLDIQTSYRGGFLWHPSSTH